MQSRYLDPREVAALRRVCRPAIWLPLQIAIDTGLRVGDVAKLRWDDISGRTVRYTAQKTGKEGIAYLSPDTAALLRRWRPYSPDGWLFPSPSRRGGHLRRQTIWKRVKAACARAGLNPCGVSPHSFRKVYGVTEYHRHGIAAVRAGLQHSDIATTEIYALADWSTGENANRPLLRSDLPRILRYMAAWLDFSPARTKSNKTAEK